MKLTPTQQHAVTAAAGGVGKLYRHAGGTWTPWPRAFVEGDARFSTNTCYALVAKGAAKWSRHELNGYGRTFPVELELEGHDS